MSAGVLMLLSWISSLKEGRIMLAGALFAILPHPLFWLILKLMGFVVNPPWPGREPSPITIVTESIIGLMFVGIVTIPASIASTVWLWRQYGRKHQQGG